MNIEILPLDLVDILSISTAFMLGLLFLTTKSKNNIANIFLGLFLWSLTTEVLESFLEGQGIEYPIFSVGLLTIPFLCLYVIKTLNYQLKLWYILFVLPFLGEFIGHIPVFIFYGFNFFLLLHVLKKLRNHRQKLADFYSDTENKTLAWMKSIVYIYLFFHTFWIVEDLIGLQFADVDKYFALLSTILTLVMIYWIGYNGFSQPEIFRTSILALEEIQSTETGKQITEDDSADLFLKLTEKIKEDKLFLQKDVTIRSLSRQLKINEKEFSKLIKIHTQKNFYHYINQFRLDEFKELLKTEKADQLSLLGLSEEAGFYSKSTFYSVFKTCENMTPKQFKDQLNKFE